MKYIEAVDLTHKGLGKLFSFCLMAQKAKKVAIVIAVAGSGKTTAIEGAARQNPNDCLILDSITRSGLKVIEKKLNGFEGTVVIGDLGNIDTSYSVKESVKTAVALTFEHHLSKMNSQMNLQISDFQGSFVTSAQPVIMQGLVNSPDWEAVVRDKTIRYYHMVRPTAPNQAPISVKTSWGKEFNEVKYKEIKCAELAELYKVGLSQWGRSRTNIHLKDMLRACAALDGRLETNKSDILVLLELTRPMRMENFIIEKSGFESGKEFLHNHICLLTEFATYPLVTHEIIATDFFVSLRQVVNLLSTVRELFVPDPKNKENVLMSDIAGKVLKECGFR